MHAKKPIEEAEAARLAEVKSLIAENYRGDPDFMTSLARGLIVLQAFRPEFHSLTVPQISDFTGLHRAVVRRCLYTLKALGFIYSPDNRHYHLLPRVLTLGHAYLTSSDLARNAQTAVEHLSSFLGESCSVATLDGDNILYIARASVKRIMKIDLLRGSRLPAHATSMGLILLSELSEKELSEYLNRTVLTPFTEYTIIDRETLIHTLQKIKAQGYAINDQQLELGLRSMAVPMYSHKGKVVAAMNVGVNAALISAEELQKNYLPRLQRAAMELALLL